MKIRAPYISKSITAAVTDLDSSSTSCPCIPSLDTKTFHIFDIPLSLHRQDVFVQLRRVWTVDEDAYIAAFSPSRSLPLRSTTSSSSRSSSGGPKSTAAELTPIGDLGYSGSTFFTTPDGGRYLIKSLPRRFEHAFFTEELLDPYWSYMTSHQSSLLVRIMDVPYAKRISLGGVLGTAPMCHIVMENLLYDGDEEEYHDDVTNRDDQRNDDGDDANDDREGGGGSDWETFDLKPADYFFPERDVADGMLASDDLIESLVDHVPHKIVVSEAARKSLLDILREDTELLAGHSAVDYSLFLARRAATTSDATDITTTTDTTNTPETPETTETTNARGKVDWRKGVPDVNGEYVYRAVVLDFFWARNRLTAKAMTGLIDTYNVVADQGPMSVTAEPKEYRNRFMKMVGKIIVGPEEA